jgi:hypothetical protein
MTLGALAKATSRGEKPDKVLHVEFGQRIYRLIFSGSVRESWQQRQKSAGRNPLALVLRRRPAELMGGGLHLAAGNGGHHFRLRKWELLP